MASNSEIFRQVASAVDIVDVIGEHLALKRAGREFKCLCPFHEDHRPSMAVVPHKQIFHCFVCGTGGDVFKFVELYHKMGKGEALRMLAQRAGIKLPELPRSGLGPQRDKDGFTARERIANTNEWACAFFEKHLRMLAGKAGLDYFHSRGLSDETINKFRLGMSPDGWTGLVSAANQAGVPIENLLEAGLVKQRQDGSPYDTFRNRVMFPIIDATGGAASKGRVIAFGGRVLEEKRDEAGNIVEAKYLNSPDSKLFNKSESLYGLNLARQQIIRTRNAIIVEGYMDVIASHQVGVNNVIATLGTALTTEHAKILKNYAQNIPLVFDSDDAGRRAADRAMEIFATTPLEVKIAAVPDGKDPCDFCMKHGGAAFQALVDAAESALTYKWNRLKKEFAATDSVTARQDAIKQFLQFAATSMGSERGFHGVDPIRRGQLIVKLSSIVGLPIEEVTRILFQLTPIQSGLGAQSTASSSRAGGQSTDALQKAEAWLIGFTLHEPQLYDAIEEHLHIELFMREQLKAELFLEYFEDSKGSDRSLAAFCSFAAERENVDQLLHAMITWEREAEAWVELTQFSAETAKLIRALRQELGHTPERIVKDCLQYMIDAMEERMRLYKRNAFFEEASLEEQFQQIAEAGARVAAGKTRGNVGYTKSLPIVLPSAELKHVQAVEDSLKPTG